MSTSAVIPFSIYTSDSGGLVDCTARKLNLRDIEQINLTHRAKILRAAAAATDGLPDAQAEQLCAAAAREAATFSLLSSKGKELLAAIEGQATVLANVSAQVTDNGEGQAVPLNGETLLAALSDNRNAQEFRYLFNAILGWGVTKQYVSPTKAAAQPQAAQPQLVD